jgi:predicted pyridoxine 5'-phosphate oxidase superfamily flavin-nucleotide-binding protein
LLSSSAFKVASDWQIRWNSLLIPLLAWNAVAQTDSNATAFATTRLLQHSGNHNADCSMNNSTLVFTPAVQRAQAERGSARSYERRVAEGFPDRVTPELVAFIAEQDTMFFGSASAAGAPYIQHRGGPKGFIKVVDEQTLGFADYRGNRQYITLANLSENDRAFMFLLDPARRQRIKFWGHARVVEDNPALVARLFDEGYKAKPERAILFTIEAWDANCSSHIVTRFSEAELDEAFSTVQTKIAGLQAENARLRALLGKPVSSR